MNPGTAVQWNAVCGRVCDLEQLGLGINADQSVIGRNEVHRAREFDVDECLGNATIT